MATCLPRVLAGMSSDTHRGVVAVLKPLPHPLRSRGQNSERKAGSKREKSYQMMRPIIICGTPKDDAWRAAPMNISIAPTYTHFLRPSISPTRKTLMAPQKHPILLLGQLRNPK